MRVAIFGGTGFVGGYLIDELIREGHTPVLLVRPESEAKLQAPEVCSRVPGTIEQPEAIQKALEGVDAAIYNIGILRAFPRRGITFEALHFDGAKQVIDMAADLGVRRILLMSANGVRADGTGYQKTKYLAEQYLQTTDLDWTIFRPSVIFGDPRGNSEFATQLDRDVLSLPFPAPLFHDGLLPFGGRGPEMSPVHVEDVARAFVASLEDTESFGRVYPLCGPDRLTWKQILETIAKVKGRRLIGVPVAAWAVKTVAGPFERFAGFPVTRDQIQMLMEGNTCDSSQVFEHFGIRPMPFTVQSIDYLR